MNLVIKIKRGTKTQIDGSVLQVGELALATDTEELYVGTGTGKTVIAKRDLSNITSLGNILNLDGAGSGLDADMLDGYHASQTPGANKIPVANSDGKLDQSWLPPISAVAGGYDRQLQYNSGGNLAGTDKILLTQDGNLNLISSSETLYPSNGISLFVKRTGRPFLWALTQHNSLFAFQSALCSKQIGFWFPAGNSTMVYAWGMEVTAEGIAIPRNVETKGFLSQLKRIGYSTGDTIGTGAGIRGTYLQWWRGDGYKKGGFLMATRFSISQITCNMRWFVGMAGVYSLLPNANPSTFTNIVGIGIDSRQATIRVLHNDDSGRASSINLGTSFPAKDTSMVYDFFLYTPSNGDRYYYLLRRADFSSGDPEAYGEITTNIPAKTQLLAPQLWISNGKDAKEAIIDICWLYMEAEY